MRKWILKKQSDLQKQVIKIVLIFYTKRHTAANIFPISAAYRKGLFIG